MEKKDIRQYIFKERANLTTEMIFCQSRRICTNIIATDAFQKADCIYVYMDCNGEVSTKDLIDEAFRSGKRIAAPKVHGEHMIYYYIESYQDVASGYFGILEPITNRVAVEENALLIIPGVAFDVQRHRCGYGKGFYDRYLSVHKSHTTIAIAFDFQVIDTVPFDVHDILPQSLYTPTNRY